MDPKARESRDGNRTSIFRDAGAFGARALHLGIAGRQDIRSVCDRSGRYAGGNHEGSFAMTVTGMTEIKSETALPKPEWNLAPRQLLGRELRGWVALAIVMIVLGFRQRDFFSARNLTI